ncbi:hypothetical protein NKH23_13225 [Mesorhizobium sp. M1328]|uniref:hypothetical protein n=1 Tax=Mesorhizobium sp. M1328 TaxID=2957082 RepID=UPI0033395387
MIENGVEIDFVTDSFQYVLTHASSDGSFQVPHRFLHFPEHGIHASGVVLRHEVVRIDRQRSGQPGTRLLPLTDIRERGRRDAAVRIFRMAASCAFGALETDPWFASG